MRREPLDRADEVRSFLERMAAEAPTLPLEPGPVLGRARRRVALTIVGGTLLLALAVGGVALGLDRIAGWNRAVPGVSVSVSPVPPTPASQSPIPITGRFDEKDIRDLVLLASERLGGYGLRHDASYSQYEDVASVASTLDVSATDLLQADFVTAYFNGFVSDSWWDASAPPKDRIDLVSYAILFPDAVAAQAGYELISAGPTTSEVVNWRSSPADRLGEEAKASRGLIAGVPTTAVVWRVDNVVLFLASQGYGGAIPLDEVLPLAERMNARAS
jgi:hypothetical protein